MLVLDDFHRLGGATARESVAWFVEHLPATVQLVLSTRADPALPLGALRAHGAAGRAAGRRPALHGRRGGRVPQRAARARARRGGRRAARRAHRGLAGRHLPRGAVADRQGDKPALVRAFDGTSAHVVDFLSDRGARRPTSPSCRPSCCARRCSSGCARRCATPSLGEHGLRRRARVARAHEPVPAAARRPARVVPLPPPVRAAPARRARAARGRARAGAARPRVRVAPRVRHRRRGDRACGRGRRARGGGGADRGERGCTTSTPGARRRCTTGCSAIPAEVLAADRRLLLVRAWIAALRGSEADMRAALARVRELGGLDDGPLPGRLRVARVERLGAERRVRAGATSGRCSRRARGRPRSRGPSRPGGRW